MKTIFSASGFTRRAIASVCMLEQMTATHDPEMLDNEEVAQFHGEEIDADSAFLPADCLKFSKEEGRYFVIMDQYNNAAGCLAVYDKAATFFYSVITG